LTVPSQSQLPLAAVLRDGSRVMVREVRPEDSLLFSAAFAGLSSEARYNRFLGAVRDLPPSLLDRAVNPVGGRELALVAISVEDGNEKILGGARYFVETGAATCEFAITVVEQCRRIGLASHMMQVLMAAARSRGMKVMRGYVLAGNTPMLALARRLGFDLTASDAGPTVRLATIDLSS
jgi:GNAT superfamily N-acetyltransferase